MATQFESIRSRLNEEVLAGWDAYIRVWRAHHRDPGSPVIRRFLGLSADGKLPVRKRRPRSAPSWLR
ncbi:MAG: hypothetical protein AAF989_03690, partial [Planctomycetota bacterium]